MKKITRQEFMKQSTMAGVAALLTPLSTHAKLFASNKIRVGVIGCGSVSTQYLPHLEKSPYVKLVSVCDIITERAKKAAEKYKVANWFPNIDSFLAGPEFDLMVTLTDMQEHERLNKQGLEAGRHVWSEKPMANTYNAGRELLNFAVSKGLQFWGAPAVVNSSQFAFMSNAIQEGKLGKVSAAHAHYGHLGPTWSSFFYEKGGGSLPDLGVYNLGSITGLLGPAKSVVAMTSIVTQERKTDDKGKIRVEAEDNAMVIMEHANGALSHVQCGFNYFDPYGHEGSGQERPTISIWGTKGNMNLVGYDWAPSGVDLATIEDVKGTRHVTDPGTYVWQQGASVVSECLVNDKKPRINAEHALHVLEVMEAARESQKTGKRIHLSSTFPYPL